MKCPVYPLDSGYLILPLYSIYRHLSSGNFSLFCKFQNNFRFLGQIAVLLDVDAAADVVAHWRRKTDRVLGLLVLGECNGHFLTLHVRDTLSATHYVVLGVYVDAWAGCRGRLCQ